MPDQFVPAPARFRKLSIAVCACICVSQQTQIQAHMEEEWVRKNQGNQWLARRLSRAALLSKRDRRIWSRLGVVFVVLALLLPAATTSAAPVSPTANAAAAPTQASPDGLAAGVDVTATGSVPSGSFAADGRLYFAAEQVSLTNTVNLNALTIVITVRKTAGVTMGLQRSSPVTLTLSQFDTGTQIVYTYTLAPGQHLRAGTSLTLVAQINGSGSYHIFDNDSFSVNAVRRDRATRPLSAAVSPPRPISRRRQPARSSPPSGWSIPASPISTARWMWW